MTWHYGCDIGARRLAVACAETHHVAEIVLPDPKRGHVEDTSRVLHQLGWWIQQEVPREAVLWVERPFVFRNIRTSLRLSVTQGAVMLAHGGTSYAVDPNVWKLAAIGDGSADKPAVRAWLQATHPTLAAACGESQDLIDAAGLSIGGAVLASEF